MPRALRFDLPGHLQHVICRANGKQTLFLDEDDYAAYLQRIAETFQLYDFKLYAYVLMPNHVHLLIERTNTPLSKIMQSITQRYVQYFNTKYKKSGNLFYDRYTSICCQKEKYFKKLVRHLLQNPVRANLVHKAEEWKWSSYQAYFSASPPSFLNMSTGFSQAEMQVFVNAEAGDDASDELYPKTKALVLGDAAFVRSVVESGGKKESAKKLSLTRLEEEVLMHEKLNHKEFHSASRTQKLSIARGKFAAKAVSQGYSLQEIADFLGRNATSIARLIAKVNMVR
ncbi:MAG: hypothetical protein COV43_05890 [Deltaproteobacteria bacterium CG11_big_fil_rev_8_21_14_0_20_42_23]|nr:MAG: hypothetical protein COV43_05890 [Deltaproteobacteria bacterium CG11_big_fil_rev_8_21_14_0_20_42_23]PJC64135.1 MAG: hypothetical protein CO021_05830 [Deltaproteobacteria bacterium CG_4_9_14_0_2_um_filter_42_21]